MDNQFPMVVTFEVDKDKIDFIKSELLKLIAPTKLENGCLQYDLHQDRDNEGIFVFYEIWENKSCWIAHDSKSHVIDFKRNTEGKIRKVTVNKLIRI